MAILSGFFGFRINFDEYLYDPTTKAGTRRTRGEQFCQLVWENSTNLGR